MESKVNYTAVGAFVVALSVALVAGVLWLTTGLGGAQYNHYLAYVSESVSGLNVNAPVKYRGVDVGFVREIGLRPGRPEEVRLLMAIEHGTPVKEDTVAVLSLQGLTGIAFIDLTGGTADAPMLYATPGEEYPVIETGPSLLARLDSAASQMFTNIERVSDSLHGFLNEETQEDFQATLASVRSFTARLDAALDDDSAQRLAESLAALHEVAGALARNAENIDRTLANLADASDQAPSLVARVDDVAASLQAAGDQFASTMRETQAEVRNVSQHLAPQAGEVLAELRLASAALRRFVDELESDPALLLHGRRDRRPGPGER